VNRITISKGKRSKSKGNKGRTVGIIIFIIIIISLLIILKFKNEQQDNNNITPPETTLSNQIDFNVTVVELEPNQKKQDEIVSVDDMPKTMTAKTKVVYNVIGKIVIEKIGVEKYILDRTTDNSLDMSVTRFKTDREINETGNFCITGHNYPNTFQKLKDLEIGDEFYLVGIDGRKVTYVIYDILSIYPENEECLKQVEGKREVTVITCEKGAVKRLVLKAEEKI